MSEEQTTPAAAEGEFKLKLEDLGPIIVNTDGSLQRIPNWSEMPQAEKDKTTRLVSTRNKKRLQALREGGGKGNMIDNVTGDEIQGVDAEVDPMKGTGTGTGGPIKSVTLTIEHS